MPRNCTSIFRSIVLMVLAAVWFNVSAARAETQIHVSSDGHETNRCDCRQAEDGERFAPGSSPDGWVQGQPRAIFNRGEVPLPLAPDWVGTRNRATGVLVWGDADGDGDEDLFVGTYYGNMYPPLEDYYNFLYLNVDGALEAEPSWISVDQRHSGDAAWGLINDDPYPDLFVANGGSSLQPSQVFFGQDGLLPTAAGWSSSDNCWTIGCALTDFDRDDDLDLATANQGNTGDPYRPVHLFRNLGDGLETVPSWQSNQIGITNAADWGDMNGDGLPDLAVSGWVNWESGVFLNAGSTLETGFAWTSGDPSRTDKGIGWSLADGDSNQDLAIGGNGDPDRIFLNEGTVLGANPYWESTESFTGCQELVWIDIDRDLDEDLALIHFSTGHVRIYLNQGGAFSTTADWQYDAASSGTALAFGDLNGDMWPDLAIGVANGPVMVFLNTTDPAGAEQMATGLPRADVLRIVTAPSPFVDDLRILLSSGSSLSIDAVDMFDSGGRRVGSMRGEGGQPRRITQISWRPGDHRGSPLRPGVYYVRARGTDPYGRTLSATSKAILLAR